MAKTFKVTCAACREALDVKEARTNEGKYYCCECYNELFCGYVSTCSSQSLNYHTTGGGKRVIRSTKGMA